MIIHKGERRRPTRITNDELPEFFKQTVSWLLKYLTELQSKLIANC